jgi:hypothetical protein
MHPAENRLGRFRRLNVTAAGDPGSGGSAMRFDAADGPDDEFIFGLDRILDGIEHLVQAN